MQKQDGVLITPDRIELRTPPLAMRAIGIFLLIPGLVLPAAAWWLLVNEGMIRYLFGAIGLGVLVYGLWLIVTNRKRVDSFTMHGGKIVRISGDERKPERTDRSAAAIRDVGVTRQAHTGNSRKHRTTTYSYAAHIEFADGLRMAVAQSGSQEAMDNLANAIRGMAGRPAATAATAFTTSAARTGAKPQA